MIIHSHTVFPTADIKATAAYYCDTLGFRSVEYLYGYQLQKVMETPA